MPVYPSALDCLKFVRVRPFNPEQTRLGQTSRLAACEAGTPAISASLLSSVVESPPETKAPLRVPSSGAISATAAVRILPWPVGRCECRDRRLAGGRGNHHKPQAHDSGLRRHPYPVSSCLQGRQLEPRRGSLTLSSRGSRPCCCGRDH